MRVLRRLLEIGHADCYLLLSTFFCLTKVRLGLQLLSFRAIHQKLIKPYRASYPYPFSPLPSVNKVVWAVNVSSRYMPGRVKCLARALTTQMVASRLGYGLDLHIGVTKASHGQLEAHAWVVYQGAVVIGDLPDIHRFVPLWSVSGEFK